MSQNLNSWFHDSKWNYHSTSLGQF